MEKTETYFGSITSALRSLSAGLAITFSHLLNARRSRKPMAISDKNYFNQPDGIATIQYPHEMLPVPDNGRYRLHNEIDDCIVCDKCAKICPVNCITIEPIRSISEFGKTSDGTPKRIFAAKFDINMGQCCFCGLCTTVCPTECLTMTKVYDFSVTDIREHNYVFAEMTDQEIKEKIAEYEKSKTETQTSRTEQPVNPIESKPSSPKPVFRPKIKPPDSPAS
jgi:formate hydrogenlyase subunit 6/NADH:ubiquinone oxidoreductase subunit I